MNYISCIIPFRHFFFFFIFQHDDMMVPIINIALNSEISKDVLDSCPLSEIRLLLGKIQYQVPVTLHRASSISVWWSQRQHNCLSYNFYIRTTTKATTGPFWETSIECMYSTRTLWLASYRQRANSIAPETLLKTTAEMLLSLVTDIPVLIVP